MEFLEIVRSNLKKDFEQLLPFSPTGYITYNIVAGYGSCRKGILSENTEGKSTILSEVDDFDFELAKKLISDFSKSKSKKPLFSFLMLFIGLVVPFRTSFFIHRLYEIKEKAGKIFLKKQSYREGIF